MEKTSGKRKTETVLKLIATALLAAILLVCPIWAAASFAADEGSQTVLPGENGQERPHLLLRMKAVRPFCPVKTDRNS